MSTDRPRRLVQIPVYWLIVGLVTCLLSPVLALVVSAKINSNTVERTLAAQEAAKAESRAEALVRYCRLIGSQVDVYNEADSTVGRAARDVWLNEYRLNGCQPRK